VLDELEISREHIRLICEQELRNLSWNLKQHFLDSRGKQLKVMLFGVVTEFIETLRVAVLLKTKDMPSWDNTFDNVSEVFKIDTLVLKEIMQLRNKKIKLNKKAVEAVYNRFMSFVNEMVGIVDKID
jgi:hypothetical protein